MGRIESRSLDWNLLRTFFIIVEERSLTKAGERLDMRQPSVSAALQRLEDTMGCTLLVRDGRRFELTPSGEHLYEECATIFAHVARIGEKIAADRRTVTGIIRILSVTGVQYPPFDDAIAVLNARFPSVQFQIDVVSSREGVRAVSRQTSPIALCLLTKPIHGLDCRLLVREEFGIFCGRPHALFARAEVGLDELRRQRFVGFTCASDGGALEPMLALGSSAGFGIGGTLAGSSTHLEEVRRMIATGVGIGIMPVAPVARDLADRTLWRFRLPGVELGADLYLVTNPVMAIGRAEAEFLKVLDDRIRADRPDARPSEGER